MKIIKFTLPVLIPLILVALCFIPQTADIRNQLLSVIATVGTLGALLFLIFDKIEKEKDDKQKFWHEHLPYLNIGSPCDPTQNRCEINLLTNNDEYTKRGCLLFSISNFSSANAYNVTVKMSTTLEFENNTTRSHYIDMIPIVESSPDGWYNLHYIYSKYHINPASKQVLLDEFDLCNFTSNCDAKRGLKTMYIRLEYYSTPVKNISKKVISDFKIDLECGESDGVRNIIINNILRIDYDVNI